MGTPWKYARVSATGVLWSVGNYGMLLRVSELGAGKGCTIAQLTNKRLPPNRH